MPCLEKPGFVDNEYPVRVAQALSYEGHEVVAHGIGVPVGTVEQALHPLRACFAEVFGKLPAVFALNGGKQGCEIASHAGAGLGTTKAGRNTGVQGIKSRGPTGRHGGRGHGHGFPFATTLPHP